MKKSLLCLALALCAALAVPSHADVNTGAAGNAVNATYVIPFPSPSRGCASVALSTRTPTLVLAARAGRIALEVVNVSTANLGGDTARPPLILLSTAATTNLGTAPSRTIFLTANGRLLLPTVSGSAATPIISDARWEQNSGSVYSGAIYAMAESSSTSGFDTLGRAEACENY